MSVKMDILKLRGLAQIETLRAGRRERHVASVPRSDL